MLYMKDAPQADSNPCFQDGKPYIISNEANRVINTSEERAHGYTIAVQTTFASLEDVKYYDEQCEAHQTLKAVTAPRRTGVATFIFESDMPPVAKI